MTSTPSAFSLVTRAVIASVADGWMRPRAAETWGLKVDIEKRPCERARGVIWQKIARGRAYNVRPTFASALLDNLPMHVPRPPPFPSSSRSEEHTSELQSLMRISYAVFCLKNKINTITIILHLC